MAISGLIESFLRTHTSEATPQTVKSLGSACKLLHFITCPYGIRFKEYALKQIKRP